MQIKNFTKEEMIKKDTKNLSSWIVLIISVIAIFPIFMAHYPPCVDIPQHAGQIELYREMQKHDFIYSGLFKIHLLTPYLLGYLIVYILSIKLSISLAIKITLACAMLATPVMTGKVLKTIGSNELFAILVVPSIYGFSFNWGFLNFIVAMPIGIMLVGMIFKINKVQGGWDNLKIAALINILFLCHALVWAFFFGVSVLILMYRGKNIKIIIKNTAPLLSSLPIVFLWFLYATKNSHSILESKIYYAMGLWRFNPLPLIFGTNKFLMYMGLFLGIIILPLLTGGKFSRDWTRYIPLVMSLLVVGMFPHSIMGIAFIYERFSPLIIPFYLILLDYNSDRIENYTKKYVWAAIYILVAIFILNQAMVISLFGKESADYTYIQNKMDEGKRVIMLMYIRNSDYSIAPVYLHLPLWYQAEKHGLVEFNAASEYTPWVQFKNKYPPADQEGFEWNPQTFEWNKTRGELYDYFVITFPVYPGSLVFKNNLCHVELVANSGNWWLFRNRKIKCN